MVLVLEKSSIEPVELYIEGTMTVSFPPVLADTSALRTSSTKIGAIPSEEALPNEATCHLGFTLLTWFGVSPLFQENIGQMKCNASKQLSSTNSCDNNH